MSASPDPSAQPGTAANTGALDVIDALVQQQEQAQRALEQARSQAIAHCQSIIDRFRVRPDELKFDAARAAASRSLRPVAPRYRNPATGETWSGRGSQPRWLVAQLASGATLESFAIIAA